MHAWGPTGRGLRGHGFKSRRLDENVQVRMGTASLRRSFSISGEPAGEPLTEQTASGRRLWSALGADEVGVGAGAFHERPCSARLRATRS
jgi:hypothetical protein